MRDYSIKRPFNENDRCFFCLFIQFSSEDDQKINPLSYYMQWEEDSHSVDRKGKSIGR